MKKLISAALALALTLSLAACGGGGGGGQGSTPNNPGAASSGGSDKPFAGQTLTVLYMSGVYADAARAMVPEFEEATGAKVEVVDFPYLTLHEKALLDLTSQTGSYDVIDVASQWDGEFAPFMEPLDSYIERDNYDMSVWIENVLANCGEWQGTIVGIPNASTPQTFAYRTDLLPDGIPDTWEGYREALAQVNDPANGLYGVTVSEVSGQLGGVFDYVLWSMGGNWADEDWNITIDSPETRAALEHLYAIKDYSDPSNLAWGVDESIQAFLDGRAAVCETWPSLGVVQNADDPAKSKIVGNWALDVLPFEKTGLTLLSAWDVSINASSENKDLAWEWIKMYTDYDMQNRFHDEFGILSPRKAFWDQDKMANQKAVRDALDTANMWWRIPASVEADTCINSAVGAYLSDQIDLETCVKQLTDGLTAALSSNPPEDGIKNYNH
ncbi:extracellular solute-binding protein [Oscillospiraceae bacterium 50-16]